VLGDVLDRNGATFGHSCHIICIAVAKGGQSDCRVSVNSTKHTTSTSAAIHLSLRDKENLFAAKEQLSALDLVSTAAGYNLELI